MKSTILKTSLVTLRAFVLILAVLIFSVPLFAQNFGTILGTVTDQTGAVLPGATVTVIDTERGLTRTLTTDAAGQYNAPTLIPGNYTIRVDASGFKRLERQNVVLEVGKEVRVDLTPQPGEQTQTVTVTEAIPLVDAASATLGGTLVNQDINDLPLNGRNYQSLLGLRPGVMLQRGGSPWTQSTNNVRPDETAWMVDGVLNANFFDAQPVAGASAPFTDGATILPVDAIQEFNLMENPKAEFGGKPGALVNVGVRSGTNAFHGSAYAFGRYDAWDARNFFNVAATNGNCISAAPTCDKTPAQLEQFGGVVGGPVKKDKLFFFAGYEGLRSFIGSALPESVPETASTGDPTHSMVDAIIGLQKAGVSVSGLSKTLMGCPQGILTTASTCTGGYIQGAHTTTTSYLSTFPNNNASDNGVAKIDYRVNDKNMIHGMMFTGQYTGVGEDFAMVNQAWTNTVNDKAWVVDGGWVYTPSSRLVNEFRMGYNRWEFIWDPSDIGVHADGKGYPINTGSTVGGFPSVLISNFQGFQLGSRRGRPLHATPNPYYNFQDNVSYLVGKHALKFGFEFSHIEGDSDAHDARGQIRFQGNQAFAGSTPLEDFFSGLPTRATLLVGNPAIQVTWHQVAGFFQDDWRITSKLMLNLGMRYVFTSPFHEANNKLGSFDPALGLVQQGQSNIGDTLWKPDYGNWAPRVGFAYDVTGKGTTIIRGGTGIFYSMFTVAPFTANPGINNTPGGTSLVGVPTGFCRTQVSVGGACPQTFGGTLQTSNVNVPASTLNWNGVVFPTGIIPSCTASAPCAISAIDRNFKTPYILNYNLGVQHAFGGNLSLDVEYVGNHGDNLAGNVDINQINPATGLRPLATQYPYLSFVNFNKNDAHSNFNSLQTTLTKRLSHGLNFTAGYTYGHGLDNGSLTRFGPQPQDSRNPQAEYASSDFDIRHRATLTAGYEIPGPKGYGQVLRGWKLNTILNLSGRQPWNIFDSADNYPGISEFNDRWNFFGNPNDFKSPGSQSIPFCTGFGVTPAGTIDTSHVSCTSTSGATGLVSTYPSSLAAKCVAVAPDPNTLAGAGPAAGTTGGCYVKGNSAMVPPKLGTFGTMGRNIFRDTGFTNVDFSIFKNFTFKERYTAQFRAEFFNLFNHPAFSNPYGSVNGANTGNDPSASSAFGCGCATPDTIAGSPIVGSGDARQMQLGFKFTF